MKVKFILPALEECGGKYWRSIKYSLFPPLGLGLLAGYLDDSDVAEIIDEHVQKASYDDSPDLVVIEVYVTCAQRAYAIADSYRARGVYVILGGLHVTAMPEEAAGHADCIVTGPAEEAWPRFLEDFRRNCPQKEYSSQERTLAGVPAIRRDLIDRRLYLVPDSLVVSRGCPHSCDFCYKENFYRGGKSFYTSPIEWALNEMQSMPGKHTFFLDDNIFADPSFSRELFTAMLGMGKVWQGAATVKSLQDERLLDVAVDSGMRCLFIGFESLSAESLNKHNKLHNNLAEYEKVISALHERGVMINASFVFGMEYDDVGVFARTVDWAVDNGLQTATFHILTPYPGSDIFCRYEQEERITCRDWNKYDTRHAVFKHPLMSAEQLESGYWQAYSNFYSWKSIWKSAATQKSFSRRMRHLAYTGAWKKFDWLWRLVINLKQLPCATPLLEKVLGFVS